MLNHFVLDKHGVILVVVLPLLLIHVIGVSKGVRENIGERRSRVERPKQRPLEIDESATY